MTYRGCHERTVVQGSDVCICGSEWPCAQSAEGRWKALRDWLDDVRLSAAQHAADDGFAERARIGMAAQADLLEAVLEHISDMEAGR